MSLQGAAYVCKGCESNLLWKETSVQRCDAAGVANTKARALKHACDLAKQLQEKLHQSSHPVWVAVQNRGELGADQYWIGKAMRIEQVYDANGRVGRTSYGPGDMEIAVEWFHRDVSGGDERRIFK
mmetsp:Transcript_40826/g.87094  ORF Transcript_40826/g.87094 Transcript_40826/m.87094 type:complete len:126 (-) Transcript_40826:316-693(-)